MHTRVAGWVILGMLVFVPPACADTVYGPGQHPLVLRNWCIHVTGAAFVADNTLGHRTFTPVVGVGFSPLRFGRLRLPVLQIQLGEADRLQDSAKDKAALLASAGIALRTADWDNGHFEAQLHVAFTRDFTSKRYGFIVGMGLGF